MEPSPWWEAVEQQLAEPDNERPDPWADAVLDVEALTDAQHDFLTDLDDQPAVPRLSELPDEE
jgi:hypothetical protein